MLCYAVLCCSCSGHTTLDGPRLLLHVCFFQLPRLGLGDTVGLCCFVDGHSSCLLNFRCRSSQGVWRVRYLHTQVSPCLFAENKSQAASRKQAHANIPARRGLIDTLHRPLLANTPNTTSSPMHTPAAVRPHMPPQTSPACRAQPPTRRQPPRTPAMRAPCP